MNEFDHTWDDVEWLIGDLDRDGYTVESLRTNNNPVSGEKRIIIDVTQTDD